MQRYSGYAISYSPLWDFIDDGVRIGVQQLHDFREFDRLEPPFPILVFSDK